MTLVNWLSSMGGPTVNIEVDFDEEIQRVLVDEDTLALMAGSLLLAGPCDFETNRNDARWLLDAKQVEDSYGEVRYDVTEQNGGWAYWNEHVKDAVQWGPNAKAGYDVGSSQ